MRYQGISANLLSLGGIAIAIGAMVDAAVVMIENAHKGLEEFREHNNRDPKGQERWQLMGASASEVGPALFVRLLVITFQFVPVVSLEGPSGRVFSRLACSKHSSMAAAVLLSIPLVPLMLGYIICGRLR